jgi:hypothetical protein
LCIKIPHSDLSKCQKCPIPKADELVQKSALYTVVAKGYLFAMYPKKDEEEEERTK